MSSTSSSSAISPSSPASKSSASTSIATSLTATTAAPTTIRARFCTLPGYMPCFLAIIAFVGTSLRTLSAEMARLSTLEAAIIATVFRSPPTSSSSAPLTTSTTPAISSATTSTATSISFQGDEVAIFTLKLLLRWLVVLLLFLITAKVAAILFVIVIFFVIIFIVGILFTLAFNTGSGRCLFVFLFLIRRFLLIFCFGFYGHQIFTPLWIVAVLFVITVIILIVGILFTLAFNSIF